MTMSAAEPEWEPKRYRVEWVDACRFAQHFDDLTDAVAFVWSLPASAKPIIRDRDRVIGFDGFPLTP
jgi:hypothetical protein